MNERRTIVFLACCGLAPPLGLGCENAAYLGTDPLASTMGGSPLAPGDGSGGRSSGGSASGGGGATAPGGGPSTGGDRNTGGSDGTGGTAPSLADCPAEAIFCNGFETSDLLSEWSSWQVNGGAVVEASEAQTRTGKSALRISLGPGATNGRVAHLFGEPVFSGALSARAFFYIPSTTTIPHSLVGVELKDDNGGGANKASLNWLEDRAVRLVVTAGTPDHTLNSGPGVYEFDTWNCAVLRVDVGTMGGVELEINGAVVLSSTDGALPPDGFGQLLVGAAGDGADPAIEIFYDDVSVATEALTCP